MIDMKISNILSTCGTQAPECVEPPRDRLRTCWVRFFSVVETDFPKAVDSRQWGIFNGFQVSNSMIQWKFQAIKSRECRICMTCTPEMFFFSWQLGRMILVWNASCNMTWNLWVKKSASLVAMAQWNSCHLTGKSSGYFGRAVCQVAGKSEVSWDKRQTLEVAKWWLQGSFFYIHTWGNIFQQGWNHHLTWQNYPLMAMNSPNRTALTVFHMGEVCDRHKRLNVSVERLMGLFSGLYSLWTLPKRGFKRVSFNKNTLSLKDLDGEIWECQGHHIPSSTQKAKDCARPGVRHATYDQLEGAEGEWFGCWMWLDHYTFKKCVWSLF